MQQKFCRRACRGLIAASPQLTQRKAAPTLQQARLLSTVRSTTTSTHASTYNHFVAGETDGDGDGLQQRPRPSAPKLRPGAKTFRLAVKDNIATAGFPTQCASRILRGHVSPFEATIVQQLRCRGAEVIGKTNMDEFGMGSYTTNSMHGPVTNPLSLGDEPLSAGGSSGGSAVAVVLGEADLALGTDTGGSVRLPASYTGIVGHRPSYGMLSRHGVFPYANSLDAVGLFATDVRPIRELLFDTGLNMEHDAHDPTSLPSETRQRCSGAWSQDLPDTSELTIGIPLEYDIGELDPVIRRAWLRAACALEAAGARIVPVSLPTTKEALCAYYLLAAAEASSNLAKYDGVRYGVRAPGSDAADDQTLYSRTRGFGFGDEVKRRVLLGTYSLSSEALDNYFIQAQRVRRLIRHDFDRVFRLTNPLCGPSQYDLSAMSQDTSVEDRHGPAQVDFLLTPTAPSFAPPLCDVMRKSTLDAYMNDVYTVPSSLAGIPAVSLPAWTKESRLPVGLQLIGQYWDDKRLLDLAARLEDLVRSYAGPAGKPCFTS